MAETNHLEALVEFDYTAQEPDELTIQKGDVIKDIRTQPGGWWEGTLAGRRGMFPDNFVKVLTDSTKPLGVRAVSGRRCRVLFSYTPLNDDELELQVNDVIQVIAEVEEGWWKGSLRGAVGVFPSNFVTEVSDSSGSASHGPRSVICNAKSNSKPLVEDGGLSSPPDLPSASTSPLDDADAPSLPPKPARELCRALFAYEAANADELSLAEGDVVAVLSKDVADKGWWKGELRGRVGLFPDNFVEIVHEEVSKKPERPPTKSQINSTNRIRDTITKPSVPNTIKSEPADLVTSRKWQDEGPVAPPTATAAAPAPLLPPVPSKKPLLPPPIKKPQRVGAGAALPAHGVGVADGVDGVAASRQGQHEFDSVERGAMLQHPTAGRARAPRRRPPTSTSTAPITSPTPNKEQELQDALVNGGLGPRTRTKREMPAPWMEELKMSQELKQLRQHDTSSSRHSISEENGVNNIPSGEKRPWKENSTEGHRVSNNTGASGSSSILLPQTPLIKSPSLSSPSGKLVPATRGTSCDIPLQSNNSAASAPDPNAHSIPRLQYLELLDKIMKLEKSLEQQRATFTQAIKEVTDKLNEERSRRTHLEQELDKLTNLVTQV